MTQTTPHAPVRDRDATPLVLLPLRLFIAVGWLRAAAEKILDPRWWDGTALKQFIDVQERTHAVAAPWLARMMDDLVPHARTVSRLVMGAEVVVGLAILLGIMTATFLVVGIALNVSFVLAGVINPGVFYIMIQGTLLLSATGASIGIGRVIAGDGVDAWWRRPQAAVMGSRHLWLGMAALLAAAAGVSIATVHDYTPAGLLAQPFAVLGFASGLAAIGASIQGLGYGVRFAATPGRRPDLPAPAARSDAPQPRSAPARRPLAPPRVREEAYPLPGPLARMPVEPYPLPGPLARTPEEPYPAPGPLGSPPPQAPIGAPPLATMYERRRPRTYSQPTTDLGRHPGGPVDRHTDRRAPRRA